MADTLKPARVRPSIRRLVWWILPPLVLIGAWQIWDSVEANRLERAREPIRAGGPGPEPDLAAPETDNAARYYAAAAMAAAGRTRSSRIRISRGAPLVEVLTAMREAMSRGGDAPARVLDAAAQQIRLDTVMLDPLDRGRALPFGARRPWPERLDGTSIVNQRPHSRERIQVREAMERVGTDGANGRSGCRVALCEAGDSGRAVSPVARRPS